MVPEPEGALGCLLQPPNLEERGSKAFPLLVRPLMVSSPPYPNFLCPSSPAPVSQAWSSPTGRVTFPAGAGGSAALGAAAGETPHGS